MKFFNKLERKFGKYAIPNLTRYIIITYGIGYLLWFIQQASSVNILGWLTLDPGLILQGQVWRIVSWVLMPPGAFDIFTLVMLLFYYNIGTVLERVWGDFRYNAYIFFGLIMTVVGFLHPVRGYGTLVYDYGLGMDVLHLLCQPVDFPGVCHDLPGSAGASDVFYPY